VSSLPLPGYFFVWRLVVSCNSCIQSLGLISNWKAVWSKAEVHGAHDGDLPIEVMQQVVLTNGVARKILGIFGTEEEAGLETWLDSIWWPIWLIWLSLAEPCCLSFFQIPRPAAWGMHGVLWSTQECDCPAMSTLFCLSFVPTVHAWWEMPLVSHLGCLENKNRYIYLLSIHWRANSM